MITARTKIVALIGMPVGHSVSPAMHNAAFEHLGLDYRYVAFAVEPGRLGQAVEGVRALGLAGMNVTVPHKENVIKHLDHVDPEAGFIGAVNTVVNTEGELKGYNTDGRGFMRSLEEEGIEAEGKEVLILGAGGAARAVCYYLGQKASSLTLFDPNRPKAEKLASDLGKVSDSVRLVDKVDSLDGVDFLINASPLGLKDDDPLPVQPSLITPSLTVVDLIYKDTPLLKEAATRGARPLNGLGMLLWQGVLAFELWTGVKPPHELMRETLKKSLGL